MTHEATSPRDEFGDRIRYGDVELPERPNSHLVYSGADLLAAIARLQATVDAERYPLREAS